MTLSKSYQRKTRKDKMRKERKKGKIRKERKKGKHGKGYSPTTTQRKLSSLKKKFATRKLQKAFRKDKCAICLDRINKKVGNECHDFHAECINGWIDRGNRSCPLCRVPIGLRRFQDIYNIGDLNRYNTTFHEYINELNELREEFDDIDPSYLEETEDENSINSITLTRSIDLYLEVCTLFINIIENRESVSEDLIEIMGNIESTKTSIEQLIHNLRYVHLDIIQENAQTRGYR